MNLSSLRSTPVVDRQEILLDLPHFLAENSDWNELTSLLTDLNFIEAKSYFGYARSLITDYELISDANDVDEYRETLKEWRQFTRHEINTFEQFGQDFPQLVLQQAFNQSRVGRVARAAEEIVASGRRPEGPWLERINRPGRFRQSALVLTMDGHTAAVNDVVALDDHRAVTASDDHSLRIWDLVTGECLKTLRGHDAEVKHVVICDGRILSAALDGTIRIWNATTFACRVIEAFPPRHTPIGMALAPNGNVCTWIETSREKKIVQVWNVETGTLVCQHDSPQRRIDFVKVINGELALGATSDGMAWLWSLVDGTMAHYIRGTPGRISSAASIGSRYAAVAGSDGTALSFDSETGRICVFNESNDYINRLAPAGPHLLLGADSGGTLYMWDIARDKRVHTMRGHKGEVTDLIGANGHAISVGIDATLRIWNLKTGDCLACHASSGFRRLANASRGRVLNTSFNSLQMWDTTVQGDQKPPDQHSDGVMRMARTADGRLVSGGRDGAIRVWDLNTGECLAILRGHGKGKRIMALLIVSNETMLSSCEDDRIIVWDICKYVQSGTLSDNPRPVTDLGLSSNGFVCAKHLYEMSVWNPHNLGFIEIVPIEDTPNEDTFEEPTVVINWGNENRSAFGEPKLRKPDSGFSGPLEWTIPLDDDVDCYVPENPGPDAIYPTPLEFIQSDVALGRVWGFDVSGQFYLLQIHKPPQKSRPFCEICRSRACRPFLQVRSSFIVGRRCFVELLNSIPELPQRPESIAEWICSYCRKGQLESRAPTPVGPICISCSRDALKLLSYCWERDNESIQDQLLSLDDRCITSRYTAISRHYSMKSRILENELLTKSWCELMVRNLGFGLSHPLGRIIRRSALSAICSAGTLFLPRLLLVRLEEPHVTVANAVLAMARIAPEHPYVHNFMLEAARCASLDVRRCVYCAIARMRQASPSDSWTHLILGILEGDVDPELCMLAGAQLSAAVQGTEDGSHWQADYCEGI